MVYAITDNNGTPISLEPVTSEESAKDSGLFFMPMPVSDSNGALMIDIFGAQRTFNIQGTLVSDATTIANFCNQLDGLANGSQNVKVYHSDKSNNNYNVLVNSVKWTSEAGAPTKVEWQLELMEGSS